MSPGSLNCKKRRCARKKDLTKLAKEFGPQEVGVTWIPFSFIFKRTEHGYRLSQDFLNSVPHTSFFNLISVPKNKLKSIGTKIAVRHQGVLLKKSGQLYIRHAYIGSKKVEEVPALDFFLKSYLEKKDRKDLEGIGIDLFQVSSRLK